MSFKLHNVCVGSQGLRYISPIAVLGLTYILLPTHNPTIDAWEYACNVKYDEYIFRSHHLLYNAVMAGLYEIFGRVQDVLRFMQCINGLAGLGVLVVLYLLLLLRFGDGLAALSWTLFAGSSFAMMRFATENETYILPLFLSLLGSFFFLKYLKSEGSILLLVVSSFLAAVSCLIHQLHVFWWLALWLGVLWTSRARSWTAALFYSLPALLVPAVYLFVWRYGEGGGLRSDGFVHFVLEAYMGSTADVSLGWQNFLLTPINFVRSFVQVHGNMALLVKSFPFVYVLVILAVIFCLFKAFFHWKVERNKDRKDLFWRCHLVAFLLHMVFAFLSDGNSEFMVMIPILVAILLPEWLWISYRKVLWLALGMYLWNLSFALLPNRFLDYQGDSQLVALVHRHPQVDFILTELNQIAVQHYYTYGEEVWDRLFRVEEASAKNGSSRYFTDILSKNVPLSRATLLSDSPKVLSLNRVDTVAKISSFYSDFVVEIVEVDN